MSRGWESKDVESQMEERDRFKPAATAIPRQDAARERELDLLELTRKRLLHEIAFASTKRFREYKQRALSHVEIRLKELGA